MKFEAARIIFKTSEPQAHDDRHSDNGKETCVNLSNGDVRTTIKLTEDVSTHDDLHKADVQPCEMTTKNRTSEKKKSAATLLFQGT